MILTASLMYFEAGINNSRFDFNVNLLRVNFANNVDEPFSNIAIAATR